MNNFYTVVTFLKEWFENDEDVNTILHGNVTDIDINKKNIYPICHLEIVNSPVVENEEVFTFRIHVLDQRNTSKKWNSDKFLKNDNELDILNTCNAVLKRFISHLKHQYNDYDITLYNQPTLNPVQLEFTNTLDGWNMEVQLAIPNNISGC